MRENEPVLLVLSVCDGKLFLRKVKFYVRNVTDFASILGPAFVWERSANVPDLA